MQFQKKNTYVLIYFVLYVLALLKIFFKSLYEGYPKGGAVISEFLINYQGGFVRRGLFGELIFFLYKNFKISPYFFIIAICILAFLILIIYFVLKFKKNGYSLFMLPFVFFLGNPVINQFWVRKEILLLLIFILIIHLSLKKHFFNLILINILLTIGVLLHEEMGFLCFPVLLLLLFQKNKSSIKRRKIIKPLFFSILQLSMSIMAFSMVLHFTGSSSIPHVIWESWENVPFPYKTENEQTVPVMISALSWSLKKGLSLTQSTFLNFDNGIHSFFGWSLIIMVIYYLLTNIHLLNFQLFKQEKLKDVRKNKIVISNFLLIQFLAVAPLFVLGYDYSRWIFLWVCSSFILFFIVPKEIAFIAIPRSVIKLGNKVNSFFDFISSKSVSFLFLLTILIGFPFSDWRLITCLQSSSLVIVLKFISIPFYFLFHVVLK